MGGWVGGWLRITLIIRLSQPSLAGVGAGAELGKMLSYCYFCPLKYADVIDERSQKEDLPHNQICQGQELKDHVSVFSSSIISVSEVFEDKTFINSHYF